MPAVPPIFASPVGLRRLNVLLVLGLAACGGGSTPTEPLPTGIGSTGGTVTSTNGSATVVVPSGALSVNTNITVVPAAAAPANARLVTGSAFDFGPTGTTFAAPVRITIRYTPANIPSGIAEASLRLYRANAGGGYDAISGSTVDTAANTVTGQTSSFSTYAALGPVPSEPVISSITVAPSTASIVAGTTQTFAATARDAGGAAITGVAFTWTSSATGVATVSSAGVATGVTAGSATITAAAGAVTGTAALTVTAAPVQVASVVVTPATVTVTAGGTVQLAAEPRTSAGVAITGRTATWTTSASGVATVSTTGLVTAVAAGQATITATVDGVAGTSAVTVNAAPPPTGGGSIVAAPLALGEAHTCALSQSGAAFCWGRNAFGQLGDGTTTERSTPVAVLGGLTFAAIATSDSDTCALTTTGTAYCWGSLYLVTAFARPVAIAGGRSYVAIAAGSQHFCASTAAGEVWCWGGIPAGPILGQATTGTTQQVTPVKVGSSNAPSMRQLTLGADYSCGLGTNGLAYCWGFSNGGIFGDGVNNNSIGTAEPRQVVNSGSYVETAQSGVSCGRLATGRLQCWGAETELGANSPASSARFLGVTDVAGTRSYSQVSTGVNTSCALEQVTGVAFCWGFNGFGQLGVGNTTFGHAGVPTAVIGEQRFTYLSAGENGVCGIATTGTLYCWGRENRNRFGQGADPVSRFAPTAVAAGFTFKTQ